MDLIPTLKEKGITNFVFPLSFFCVGIPVTYNIEDIKEDNAYIYVNRIMDSKSINDLNKILHNLPKNIKGIIFDDLGVIEITKDLNIEKILYLTHFNTNYESINYFFEYVDEIIVSTDITETEIDEIISKTNKDISIFAFGLVPAMYSRRTLLENYAIHNNIEKESIKYLNVKDEKFVAIENEYGVMIYHYPYYNALKLLDKKAKYFFYLPILLEEDKILKLIDNNLSDIEFDEGFLNKKTIYKIKDKENI